MAMPTCKDHSIRILLTRQTDRFSKLFLFCTAAQFSHASIGLEDKMEFFSFATRGFRTEHYPHGRQDTACMLYQIDVSEEAYLVIQEQIARVQTRKDRLGYNFLGVLCCLLHIPYRRQDRYFCSQFVSELLTVSGGAKLRKEPSLYRPDDFMNERALRRIYEGPLSGLSAAFLPRCA